jgi:hypothetical protein
MVDVNKRPAAVENLKTEIRQINYKRKLLKEKLVKQPPMTREQAQIAFLALEQIDTLLDTKVKKLLEELLDEEEPA